MRFRDFSGWISGLQAPVMYLCISPSVNLHGILSILREILLKNIKDLNSTNIL